MSPRRSVNSSLTGAPAVDVLSIHQALVVTEQLSFRRAAAALGIRQSAVSHRIRTLEETLGVSLFERRPRGVRLTLAGVRFLERAKRALDQLDYAVAGAQFAGQGQEGRLRIGIFTPLAEGFLRKLLSRFAQSHPRVAMELREASRRSCLADLRANLLDIVFVTGSNAIGGCETSELWTERIHIALPANHPLASRDRLDWSVLAAEHFIVSRYAPGPEIHDYIVRRLASFLCFPKVERIAVSSGTILDLVGMGFGIGVVSASRTTIAVPDVVFRPLTDSADIVPYSAVWTAENDNPALRRFLSAAHVMAGRARPGTSDWMAIDANRSEASAAPDSDDNGAPA